MEPRSPLAAPLVLAGLSTLADRYDVLLCDLWGVMHDGRRAAPAAVDAVSRFRAGGGTVIFITNAPRPRPPVEEQIAFLGVPRTAYDGIVTSGDVTVAAILAEGDRAFYHIGPERDRALFAVAERQSGRAPRLTGLASADCVVVTGLFDDRTETPDDYRDQLRAMRERDLTMICANPDVVVHVGDHLIFCGGALAQAYGALGGRTVLAGKPHKPIYEASIALAAQVRGAPVDRRRVLAVGDGQVTDLAGAANEGLDMLFITRGIHRDDFHPEEDNAPVPLGYAAQLAAMAQPPLAAMPELAW